MDIIKVMQNRRSVRKYKTDTIPGETLMEVFDAARRSPSWANTQVTQFIVVKDQEVKKQLVDTLTATNPARTAVIDAPVLACLVAKRGVSGYHKGEPSTEKGDWFMFDAGIAMEHLVLAAWNFGLGTVHVGNFDAAKAEAILGIPEGYSIVEITPIGYFEEAPQARPRKAMQEYLYLNRFGEVYIK
jgi:nitroreductase